MADKDRDLDSEGWFKKSGSPEEEAKEIPPNEFIQQEEGFKVRGARSKSDG